MEEHLRNTVFLMNPWLTEPAKWPEAALRRLPVTFIERRAYTEAGKRWRTANKAHLVVGPRQSGKTTLIWKHLASTTGPRVLGLNLEDRRIRDWCGSAAVFVEDLRTSFGTLDALFLDEAQHLEEAALFVKGVVDLKPGFPLLVTGSSAFHLRDRTRESLAGRATRTTLFPFAISELLDAEPPLSPAAKDERAAAILDRHVRFGGYPEVWSAEDESGRRLALDGLVEAFLSRDASDLFRVRRPEAMGRLIELAARQSGSLVNLSEWAQILGISRPTAIEYVQMLADAHLVALVPVYARGKRVELTSANKMYFIDTGLRNAVIGDFRAPRERTDAGPLLETWVFSELVKRLGPRGGLHYWRTRSGAEVDFVVETAHGPLGFEVKAGALASPRLSRSSRSFIEAYAPRRFFVINETLRHADRIGRSDVRWITFLDLGRGTGLSLGT